MKAALIYGKENLRIEEVEAPSISENEALVKVSACGVCPTDVKKYLGSAKLQKVPFITGHEFTGEIINIGKQVKRQNVHLGEKVVVAPVIVCGNCYYCKSGKVFSQGVGLCRNYKVIGHSIDGAFAEYVSVPSENIYKLPKDASMINFTIVEPVAACLHAVNTANVGLGDKVLIVGAGFMGLVMLQLCKIKGADVCIADFINERLQIAKELGADKIFNPTDTSVSEFLIDFTKGIGVDKIIFGIGGKDIIENYIFFVAKGGNLVVMASTFPETTVELNPNLIHYNMINIKGSVSYNAGEFINSIDLVSKNLINSQKLITEILDLKDIEKAFKEVKNCVGLRKVIKIFA